MTAARKATPPSDRTHRAILQAIAERAMLERGLLPAFSASVWAELKRMSGPADATRETGQAASPIRDLSGLPWSSIDNDDSRDLDQLTVADTPAGGEVRIRVAVADVDALVTRGSAIDLHASHNTTSVYTAARVFPMLPERLSTDLTSLNPNADRLAVVVDMVVGADGAVRGAEIYRARVRNRAKLAYRVVGSWLEGEGPAPQALAAVDGLEANLREQDRAAQRLRSLRHVHGALSLETAQARPRFDGERIRDLEIDRPNRARQLIEDFMIAANGVTARYLASNAFPSIRRVVRTPKRWDRIVALAQEHGSTLPAAPDARSLDAFLVSRRTADPERFPDLSLAVIKLLGAGEYVGERPGEVAPGHFGLAVQDYAHSTAPNRRYLDLITQRLLKAALAGLDTPYAYADLDVLARHLTEEEDAANKVERQVAKSAAAILLEGRLGEHFDAIVTGASEKGTWVRLLAMPVEGRVVRGFEDLDVGDRVEVQLTATNVERGFIDFAAVAPHAAR